MADDLHSTSPREVIESSGAIIITRIQAGDDLDYLETKLRPAAAIARLAALSASKNDPDMSYALQAVASLIDDAHDHIESLLKGL